MNETSQIPDNLEILKPMLCDALKQNERYREVIETLESEIRLLKKALFGSKTEKRPIDEDSRQLHLFNEAEIAAHEEGEEESTLVVPEHERRRPKRKPLPPDLPRIEVIHDIPDEEKICSCGAELSCIGSEVSEKLDIVPAKIQVIRNVRLKYACKACEGVESDGPAVKIAPPPLEIIPKGIATPGLLAHIAISKYADALPLYRQEKIFARHGIVLSRSTMAGWMVELSAALSPIMALFKTRLLRGPLINVDETPIQVLNEPGRKNTTDSYMWVFRGGDPGNPVVLFKYSETRSGDVPKEVLLGYRGYVQTDGFSGYDGLEKEGSGILLVGCFAHARRYFVKVIDARAKSAKKKTGSAEVALEYIRKLYRIEKALREKSLPQDELRDLRRDQAEPVLDELKDWMDKRSRETPPKGLLGEAFNYALNNWTKLIRYLEDGHITPDNNAAENAIRPFVVGRKNWLFAGHPNGAHTSATLYAVIETAKACGLNPYAYLRFLFAKLPMAKGEEDYMALLPQSVSPEQLASFMASV